MKSTYRLFVIGAYLGRIRMEYKDNKTETDSEKDADSFRVRSEMARRERNVKRSRRVIFFNAVLALVVIMFVLISKIISLQSQDANVDEPSKAAMEQKGGKALANADSKNNDVKSEAPKETASPKPTEKPDERKGAEKWLRTDLDPDKPMVALTFDDGPYTPVTKRILKVIKKNDARVTFFVVANRIPSFPKVLKQAYDEGNQIASHTYGHVNLSKLDKKKIKTELSKANKEVKKVIGCEVTALRPPGGNISNTMRKVIDVPMIYWSVDTEDWKSRNKKKVLNRCKEIEDGDIVLMHDLYHTTADAVETLVPRLKKKGFQLVTIDELFYYKGIKMKAGKVYASGK